MVGGESERIFLLIVLFYYIYIQIVKYLYINMGNSLNKALFEISSSLGIHPKWENELIKSDYHLQTYKRWEEGSSCESKCKVIKDLYLNRIHYLKGWID
jgi:hypothetical protein|tara:strand:+ start:1245 stop:1541 length:297 start_codon:yes stop_codon:yes gene_type:complete